MPPPIKPCNARQTIISSMVVAVEHIRLIAVKPAAEMVKMTRVDSIRDRKPDSGIMMTSAMR